MLPIPSPEVFLSLVKSNPGVLKGLIDQVMMEARIKLLQSPEVLALSAERKRLKTEKENRLFLELERESVEGRRAQVKRVMKERVPSLSFSLWKYLDRSGQVYGFEYPVVLLVGSDESSAGSKALCELAVHADVAHVSLLFRAGKLYKSLHPEVEVKCYLLGDDFIKSAHTAALKTGVELVKIDAMKRTRTVPLQRRNTVAPSSSPSGLVRSTSYVPSSSSSSSSGSSSSYRQNNRQTITSRPLPQVPTSPLRGMGKSQIITSNANKR